MKVQQLKTWNWQQNDWPHFRWDPDALKDDEAIFLRKSGVLQGATKHFKRDEEVSFVVDIMTKEAIKTSEIEGEYLDRSSVQSSILKNLGMATDHRRVKPGERGIADLVTDLHRNFSKPLTHKTLFNWHQMLTRGRRDLKDMGRYRTHTDPMQIVSGNVDNPKIHFEAPPSKDMKKEMNKFLTWWRDTAPGGRNALTPLTRTGVAHLYFLCIHPFEDGNGRIGRVLAEKSLAEIQGQPTLIALSLTIERNRSDYYEALERNNKNQEITNWLRYFSETILKAQKYTIDTIDFLIEKTKLLDRLKGKLNERQEKVLLRIFREGIEGFKGGLSAENYIRITGASRATATRDLQSLVTNGALIRTGDLKSTRYHLNVMEQGSEFTGIQDVDRSR